MILANIMSKVKVSRDYEIEIDLALGYEEIFGGIDSAADANEIIKAPKLISA